ncbi:MAG: [FeFe] hydrogenase H-cluster maturation GTPase HydF [Ruminococcaceae bacterium]|nr:[FeFe] hydrogenase H-cluster maturation GTPase HydF [Oscillospiraceae bacterium]
MSLNASPSSERLHISFFGMRNAGKSSLVNAVTGQELSLVSDVKGTTTDPVKKAMELLPLGPVVITDTPGYDDEGTLGEMRVKKTKQVLEKTDFAVLVVDAVLGLSQNDKELISMLKAKKVPFIVAYNKADLLKDGISLNENELAVSALLGSGITELKEKIAKAAVGMKKEKPVIDDLVSPGDTVVLVTPIDESAPKGRLILPQQITLRNILDNNCSAVVCRETELEGVLDSLCVKPRLVITDSQAFSFVSKIVPEDIPLTSFSIVFARYKGDLAELVRGAVMLKNLADEDKVLISEGCTHHRQCNDIGTVKMPGWIKSFTGKNISFSFTSGGDFPENPGEYKLVVHCGGCMLGDKEMASRIEKCKNAGVPMVNYGVAIAMMHGILERSLEPFSDVYEMIKPQGK